MLPVSAGITLVPPPLLALGVVFGLMALMTWMVLRLGQIGKTPPRPTRLQNTTPTSEDGDEADDE